MKDAGTQSFIWSGFSSVLAWLGDNQNLMMISLAIGIITTLVNLFSRFQEYHVRAREEERTEELHALKVKRLKQGLSDETR